MFHDYTTSVALVSNSFLLLLVRHLLLEAMHLFLIASLLPLQLHMIATLPCDCWGSTPFTSAQDLQAIPGRR